MIKMINNGGSLSETDLALLSGTELLLNMMRNRILIVVNLQKKIKWEELLGETKGLYHIRSLDKADTIYQVWFEHAKDLDQFKKDLMVSKLATD